MLRQFQSVRVLHNCMVNQCDAVLMSGHVVQCSVNDAVSETVCVRFSECGDIFSSSSGAIAIF